MTLREEYEALASIVAAAKGKPAWSSMNQCAMLDAALSLCLRAVDEAESKEAECVAWNEAANGYDAEIASLLADIARLRAEVERLSQECRDRYRSEQSLVEWLDEMATERDALRGEADALRFRLAEADGLLAEEASEMNCERDEGDGIRCGECWVCRARAHLAQTRSGESASKEE